MAILAIRDVLVDEHKESPVHTEPEPKLVVVQVGSNAWELDTILICEPSTPELFTDDGIMTTSVVAKRPWSSAAIF